MARRLISKRSRGFRSRNRRRKYSTGKRSRGICDRSGWEVAYKQLILEPGTNLMVDKSWSDGVFNRVDHPQNFPADVGEAIGLENPRTDITDPDPNFLKDSNGDLVLDGTGQPIFVN